MKRAWIPLFAILIAVAGTAIGLFFHFRPTPIIGARVQIDHKYHLTNIRSGFFRYPDENGMPSRDIIHMQRYDASFGIFENGGLTFRLVFVRDGIEATELVFVVTQMRHTRTGTRATLRNIYDGDLREYRLTTTPDQIRLSSTVIYELTIASQEFAPAPTEEIFRDNTYVLKFAVTTPPHLPGGA